MRNRLARMLRQAANKLDPPKPVVLNNFNINLAPGSNEAARIGEQLAARAIRYGNNAAAEYVKVFLR